MDFANKTSYFEATPLGNVLPPPLLRGVIDWVGSLGKACMGSSQFGSQYTVGTVRIKGVMLSEDLFGDKWMGEGNVLHFPPQL